MEALCCSCHWALSLPIWTTIIISRQSIMYIMCYYYWYSYYVRLQLSLFPLIALLTMDGTRTNSVVAVVADCCVLQEVAAAVEILVVGWYCVQGNNQMMMGLGWPPSDLVKP